MKYFLVLLLVLARTSAGAQAQSTRLDIGVSTTMYSAALGEDRTHHIYLPDDFDPQKTYSVVYLLDGGLDEDFLHVAGLVQFFRLTFRMPDCIVVGIRNVDRKRDFTFHTERKDLKKDYPTTGHSGRFIRYIEEELQPHIAKSYKTGPARYLIGQSLGGLLATEILVTKPQMFTHYFIVSPSLWWDEESLLNHLPGRYATTDRQPEFVYIATGRGEDPMMQREAKALYDSLLNAKKAGSRVSFNAMEKENHATILHQSLYEGLLLLFPYKE